MVFLHISDLHLGKTLQNKSLIEEQREWSRRFLDLVRREQPDAIVIAGDVYDRAAPSGEAVELLDRFLTDLLDADGKPAVMVVAGNHDSGQRLAFGSGILSRQRLYIAGRTERDIMRVELSDDKGPVSFWLMPYTFPAAIGQALGVEEVPRNYTDAVKLYLGAQNIDRTGRNVLVAHQSVTSDGKEAEQGGSETMIGGVGGIDVSAFDDFDYVALGHIHKGQHIGRETVRYAGSPLCYHFDETRWPRKGALRVELGEKGQVDVRLVEIPPPHPLRVVEGAYDDIVRDETASPVRGEYVKVVLTDRRMEPAISDALHALFSMKDSLVLETLSAFGRMTEGSAAASGSSTRERTLAEKFSDFWRARHAGADPDDKTLALIELAAGQVESGSGAVDDDAQALVTLAGKED